MSIKQLTDSQLLEQLGARLGEVELENIALLESACRRSLNLQFDNLPNVGEHGLRMEARTDKHQRHLGVFAAFRLKITNEDADDDDPVPIMLHAVFLLEYKLPTATPADSKLQDFARVMGALQAWPFWREFVHSTIARMGLPAISVPHPDLNAITSATVAKPRRRKARRRKTIASKRK